MYRQTSHTNQSPKTMRIISKILLLYMALFVGCYHDKEEELVPCTADTSHVHYAPEVTSILTSYGCYGCHVGTAPEGGISLEGYAAVKKLVDNGRLLGAVSHVPGFAPMPHGAPKMTECDINIIKAWVIAGAPDH